MKPSPVVGIYFKDPGQTDDPLAKSKYQAAYFELMHKLSSRGARPVVVRSEVTYDRKDSFSKHWRCGVTADPALYIEGGSISVDVLFNRGRLVAGPTLTARTVNDAYLDKLEDDKSATQTLFGEYMPPAVVVKANGPPEELAKLSSDKVVLKHVRGRGGHGVFVTPAQDAAARIAEDPERNWVVQEYIDSSQGIPGIIDCEHDVRILLLGGRITGCVVRPRDLWFQGKHDLLVVRSFMIELSKLPVELTDMVAAIDRHFDGMLRYYSQDFVYANGRWYLLEINSTPGLIPENRGPLATSVLGELADYLIAAAQ